MRERVFGIETEYAVIYHPGRRDRRRPSKLALYRRFETELHRRVRSLPNAFSPLRAKLGRFLENGATFHYEATADAYEDGLIEMASPECRDPDSLLHAERAKDELVEELAQAVNLQLELDGFSGRVSIGKNNVDSEGHSFGSHESYWVEDPIPLRVLLGMLPLWVALWGISLPVLAFVILGQLVLITALGLLGLVLLGVGALLAAIRPTVARPFFRWVERQLRRLEASPGALARYVQHLSIPMLPLMRLHSHFYNRLRHRRFRENLTAFLITRTLYCGAGAICFDGGPLFRLAQRPPFLRALSRIFSGGEDRPIFENRDLFFRPWNSFRSRGRLHLMLGDANLCEWAQRLRIGATALVLEAIESGVAYEWPVLADPLAALAELNSDVELRAALPLADGSRETALEIQRRYLAGVRQALAESGSLGVAWKARVLADWQETLELLATDRERLSDRVDWLAKRQAFLRELDSPEDGEVLRRRGQALMEATDPADPEERRLRELAFRLRRVDLRYHELSPRGGYRRLESAGLVRRLSDPILVERARHEPPGDTRAWARGQAIKWAHAHALSGGAAWHRVRLGKFGWRWFGDPLDSQKDRPGRTTGR